MRSRELLKPILQLQHSELADLIRSVVRKSKDGIDPATRTFQALRIWVNSELDEIRRLLAVLPDVLRPGGQVALISFHSLEDRLVKRAFKSFADPCDCPKALPVCQCGKVPTFKVLPVSRLLRHQKKSKPIPEVEVRS